MSLTSMYKFKYYNHHLSIDLRSIIGCLYDYNTLTIYTIRETIILKTNKLDKNSVDLEVVYQDLHTRKTNFEKHEDEKFEH